jgi:hypothetical protein
MLDKMGVFLFLVGGAGLYLFFNVADNIMLIVYTLVMFLGAFMALTAE